MREFKVGDKVINGRHLVGSVTELRNDSVYPVIVTFTWGDGSFYDGFTKKGRSRPIGQYVHNRVSCRLYDIKHYEDV